MASITIQESDPERIRSELMKHLKFIKKKCEESLNQDKKNKSYVKSVAYTDIIKISSQLIRRIEEFIPILNSPDIFNKFLKEKGFSGHRESTVVEDVENLIRDYYEELKILHNDERSYLGLGDLKLLGLEIESILINIRKMNELIDRIIKWGEKKIFNK
jgi:hypothetical protein